MRHLTALVAAARRARLVKAGTPERMSQAAQALVAALSAAAGEVGEVQWELDERGGKVKLDVRGEAQRVAEVLRRV